MPNTLYIEIKRSAVSYEIMEGLDENSHEHDLIGAVRPSSVDKKEYVSLLNEQTKQMKIFSKLVGKAQDLVQNISEDLRSCGKSDIPRSKSATKNVIHNVSTQIDLLELNHEKSEEEKENVEKPISTNNTQICDKKDAFKTTDSSHKQSRVEKTHSIELNKTNGIEIKSTTDSQINLVITGEPTKAAASTETTKSIEDQTAKNEVVDVNRTQSAETITVRNKRRCFINESKDENLKNKRISSKLSTHLMPPVEIRRKLVTQRIPDIIINSDESNPQTDISISNVGYEIVNHVTDDDNKNPDKSVAICVEIDKIVEQSLSNIQQMNREELPNLNSSRHSSRSNQLKREYGKNELNLHSNLRKTTTELYLQDTVASKINNAVGYLAKPQKDKILKHIVGQISENPAAQATFRSHQVLEEQTEEVDENVLSFIDNEVYKTFVNPEGLKNVSNSESKYLTNNVSECPENLQTCYIKPSSCYDNKSVQVDGTLADNNDGDLRYTKIPNPNMTFELKEDKRTSFSNSSIHRNSHSDFENVAVNRHSEFTDMHNLLPTELSHRHSILKTVKSKRNSNTSDIQSIMSNINSRPNTNENLLLKVNSCNMSNDNTKTIFQRRKSLIRSVDKDSIDISDTTEKVIFSIDAVALKRMPGFYDHEKVEDLHVVYPSDCILNGDFQHNVTKHDQGTHCLINDTPDNSITSEEFIIAHDMRKKTSSSGSDESSKRVSKKRHSTSSTTESMKIFNLLNIPSRSVIDATHCFGCTKFCFSKCKKGSNDAYVKANKTLHSSAHHPHDKNRLNKNLVDLELTETNEMQRKHSVKIEEPGQSNPRQFNPRRSNLHQAGSLHSSLHRSQINPSQNDRNVETFIQGLTNRNTAVSSPLDNSLPSSTLHTDYSNANGIGIIKKPCTELNQTKDDFKNKKFTIMSMNIQQPTFVIDHCQHVNAKPLHLHLDHFGVDKYVDTSVENLYDHQSCSTTANVKSITQTNRPAKNQIDILTTNMEKLPLIEEGEIHSEGEVKGKCDSSIGELHVCATYPENVFVKELQESHKQVMSRKAHYSNWISYYVSGEPSNFHNTTLLQKK